LNTSTPFDNSVKKDSWNQVQDAKGRTHWSVAALQLFRDQALATRVEVVVAGQVLVERAELANHQALSRCLEAMNHSFLLQSVGFMSYPSFSVPAVDS
jgi:hypothetical protein